MADTAFKAFVSCSFPDKDRQILDFFKGQEAAFARAHAKPLAVFLERGVGMPVDQTARTESAIRSQLRNYLPAAEGQLNTHVKKENNP